ncbi:DNA polymerase domain-containing protein [Virgibacillus salexigens]|uniref:DNA polymerase domain-containing protein n=1 Tax=Virgibacillus salexigens TaxID=61016 RepID=UPI00190A8742|nr:DNA polymerase domain-containing protein [Virgibacillus salexigens]
MFTFYDLEIFKQDWLAVFIDDEGEITEIHNDSEALRSFLSHVNYLVGYNNYNYDDRVTAGILKGMNPYEVSQKIMNNKPFKLRLQNPLSLDVMQELKGLSLKEAQANLGQSIIESPVDFNIDRPLSKEEIQRTFQYCRNDVLVTKQLFEEREDYFVSKFEMVKEFKLPAKSIKKTRANLAAEILKANPSNDNERLHITYDDRLPKHEIPAAVTHFYEDIEKQYKEGVHFTELEKEKIVYKLAGIDHIYGFGGLHAAKERYKGEGNYMQIDIASYYPSLIINNGFIDNLDDYKKLYHQRQQLKLAKEPKELVYKILLNSVYGAMKSKYSKLYNPRQANNIVVNGQLIITHLICLLENFVELIQTNTDGIIIRYEKGFEKNIIKLLELFEKHYDLTFDVDFITKIAQRDVNNYVFQYKDGYLKAKGRFANYEGGNFERNSYTIIDKALVDYYMNGIQVNQTVIHCWKYRKFEYFQLVTKAGKFDGMAQEIKEDTLLEGSYSSHFEDLQQVNRVIATKNKYLGSIFKTKNDKETKYSKVPYTSDNCFVWNDELKQMDKRKINLNWYIKQIEGWLF